MSKGWISLHRQIWDNWVWKDKPFSKGQAWIDLLLMANHEDKKVMFGNQLITIKRGSFVTSIRNLCDRWGWSNTKVRTFLSLLEQDGMIIVKSDAKKTTLTIVNYSIYQDSNTSKNDTKTTVDFLEDKNRYEQNDAETTAVSIDTAGLEDNSKSKKRHRNDAETTQKHEKNDAETTAVSVDIARLEDNDKSKKRRKNDAETTKKHTNNNNNKYNNIYNAVANEVDSVISFYVNSLNDYNPNNIQAIESYMDDMQPALVKKAIEIAVERNKRFYRYVRGILENWLSKGIKTLEEYEREELHKPQQREESFGGPYVPNVEETRKMLDELLRGMKYESTAP